MGRGGVDDDLERRRAWFDALVREELADPLYRYLRRRTDEATADDVLSETLLVCWRRSEELPAAPMPWAYGVARRCLANAERSARRQRRVAAKVAELDRAVHGGPAATGRDDALHEGLARLRADEAELLRLWAWEQLTPAEIATVLGISANAVSIRLHRARGRLREELRKIEAVAGHERAEGGNDG